MDACRHRILIVDDDVQCREVLFDRLTDEGYAVDQAGDGYEALRIMETHNYALILLDQQMPGMTGLEVLEISRRRSPDTPVVMVTGLGHTISMVARERGAYACVTKPCDLRAIVMLIRCALGEAG